MKKDWFPGVKTLDELKAKYRELARKHHPDHGGSTEDMQEINAQYDKLSQVLPKQKADGTTYQPRPDQREAPEAFRAAVLAVINLEGVELELCGTWLWATGDTKPHKDTLKAAGYHWSHDKAAWYWHEPGYRKVGKTTMGLDEIRATFGSETVTASTSSTHKRDKREPERLSA